MTGRPYCYAFDSGALARELAEQRVWPKARGAWRALWVNLRRWR